MRREGLRPTRLTKAWVPFVVASTVLVREGGRVGLVLPAELLQVGYAAQLRDFLLRRFRDITLLTLLASREATPLGCRTHRQAAPTSSRRFLMVPPIPWTGR